MHLNRLGPSHVSVSPLRALARKCFSVAQVGTVLRVKAAVGSGDLSAGTCYYDAACFRAFAPPEETGH